ncbi:MAG TPA: TPM domain-containing protein [Burkholderiales bacterium]|nr:TPM domain-containing protein [Burkholderiales bacterium]
MDFVRILRHLATSPRAVKQAFPASSLAAIEAAIAEAERSHAGEIRFALEGALELGALLRGQSPRERAMTAFSRLGVWDTEHNNGVLIYVLLADRDVEIVADRGITARVGAVELEAICRVMESAFREGRFKEGAADGVGALGRLLAQHFPRLPGEQEELPDRPEIL